MKKLYTLLTLAISIVIHVQAPQGFNYQATVRNSSGALMVNQNVYFKFNVMQNSPTSAPVYSETHYVPTDDLGAINLTMGQGTAATGTFSTINWASGSYYLGIELNTGSGYVAMGTTQLLSVPYALYAQSSGTNASIGAINTNSNANGATINSGMLNLSPADAINGGVMTTGVQTIAGAKTFSSDLTVSGITIGKGAKENGVIFFTRKELVGRLPSNTLNGINFSICDFSSPFNSLATSFLFFPFISASVCAGFICISNQPKPKKQTYFRGQFQTSPHQIRW